MRPRRLAALVVIGGWVALYAFVEPRDLLHCAFLPLLFGGMWAIWQLRPEA